MDTKWFARAGAVAFAGVAITATALQMRAAPESADLVPDSAHAAGDFDPLRAGLIHCQSIGQAGASDPSCLRIWAQNRRRFLASAARSPEPLPDETASVENDADADGGRVTPVPLITKMAER